MKVMFIYLHLYFGYRLLWTTIIIDVKSDGIDQNAYI